MTKNPMDYKLMMEELNSLLTDMQAEDLDVDAALVKYARGQKLIADLNKYLEAAENKITKHKLPNAGELS